MFRRLPKYHFVLEGYAGLKMPEDARTLRGVKSIFKKMRAHDCVVYKRFHNGVCSCVSFITFHR